MDIKNILFELSSLDGVGCVSAVSEKVFEHLSKYMPTEKNGELSVLGVLKGESDYTLMVDAHLDQVAMVVTDIDDNGFLTVAKAGGIDIRALASREVTVHAKEKINAVFCSTPPHLKSGESEYTDIANIKLDTGLGKNAKEIVSLGDFVTFKQDPFELLGGKVCGRSFDNRASVACLLELSYRLSGKKLPVNVAFVFSDGEELGLRGIRTSTFKINPDEAIAVDVTFGDAPGVSDEESCKLGEGAMIGFAASLDDRVSKKLVETAKTNGILYGLEVMGANTGTNADMIAVTREGVKTATVSIPLRNMHSEVEILDIKDLQSVVDLLEKYILAGGVKND